MDGPLCKPHINCIQITNFIQTSYKLHTNFMQHTNLIQLNLKLYFKAFCGPFSPFSSRFSAAALSFKLKQWRIWDKRDREWDVGGTEGSLNHDSTELRVVSKVYRVFHLLVDWVGLTVWPILHGMMQIRQKRKGSWEGWSNTQIKIHEQMGHPVSA